MRDFINAVKATPPGVFDDGVLLPFKKMEKVLRGVPPSDYYLISDAFVNPSVWSPYKKVVDELKIQLDKILRLTVKEDIEYLTQIPLILSAKFDRAIIQDIYVKYILKRSMDHAPKEFKAKTNVRIIEGPNGSSDRIKNYTFVFMNGELVINTTFSVNTVNNFGPIIYSKDADHSLFDLTSVVDGFESFRTQNDRRISESLNQENSQR